MKLSKAMSSLHFARKIQVEGPGSIQCRGGQASDKFQLSRCAASDFGLRSCLAGGLGFALGCFLLVGNSSAQSYYHGGGGESAIAGHLPGDEDFPQMSLNADGGYLIWHDNASDGDGLGIRAAALDSSLSLVQAPFRVNQTTKGDQERPHVALLNNGGAVFVWQGGRQGFQHIYARFTTSSNTWVWRGVPGQ